MTILWTTASFTSYLLGFLNKYFEGSVFLNYYLDSVAGFLGCLFSILTYKLLLMQWSFASSLSLTLFGAIWILVFQQGYLSPDWVGVFMPEKSPYPEGSEESNKFYLATLIPAVVFFTKIGTSATFTSVYLASYSENCIFPFYKRATSIGICNFVARAATITSSLAAELDKPWPIALTISLVSLALITTFFLPTYAEEKQYEQDYLNLHN
jgi:hypothetical protein